MSTGPEQDVAIEQLIETWSQLAIHGADIDTRLGERLLGNIAENVVELLGRMVTVRNITEHPGILCVNPNDPTPETASEQVEIIHGKFFAYSSNTQRVPRLLLKETIELGQSRVVEVYPVSASGQQLVTIDVLD